MKVLIFDISGEFAHFKPYDTTSTRLSYSFPTPPTVFGMLGAIIGLPKKNQRYLKLLNAANTKVAVSILNPIKKVQWGLNFINTKIRGEKNIGQKPGIAVDLSNGHTQVLTEFVKNTRYRIVVSLDNAKLYNVLKRRLVNKESYYDLFLGITECLADFDFVGEFETELTREDSVQINSIIPVDKTIEGKIDFSSVKEKITMPRIPFKMVVGRVASYKDVLVNEGAEPFTFTNIECYKTDVCNFLFLN